MNKTIFYYALAGAVFGILFFLGPLVLFPEKYMNPENYGSGEVIGYSIMIISMLPVYFGTRAYRRHHADNLSFGKALQIAFLITLTTSAIFYLGNVLVYEVLAPNFLAEFGENYKEHLLSNAKSEEQRAQMAASFEAEAGILENSYLYALVMAGTVFFIGLILSLISALALRTKKS